MLSAHSHLFGEKMNKLKISKFIIKQNYKENEVLLFNTLTTSMIMLSEELYKKIFINKVFEDLEIVNTLKSAGFLINENFDELAFMESLRKKTLETNSHSIDYFVITPTMDCNARCYYCFEQGAHHEKMTPKTAEAVVQFILRHCSYKKAYIHWFGGEPTMATDIIDYISDKLIKSGIEISAKLTTNGLLFDEKVARNALHHWKVWKVQFTIDALNEEYNKIKRFVDTSIENPFEVVLTNIKSALDLNFQVGVRINFNPLDIKKTKEIILYLKKRFKKYPNIKVYFAPIDSHSPKVPSIAQKFEQLEEHPLISLLNTAEDFCGFGDNSNVLSELSAGSLQQVLKQYLLHPIPNSCYGVCNSSVSIDSLGDIYICHRLLGKGKQFSSGNIFYGIEKNKIYKDYSDYKINQSCNHCEFLPLCQGGCKHRRQEYGDAKACTPIKGVADKLILRVFNNLQENKKYKEK